MNRNRVEKLYETMTCIYFCLFVCLHCFWSPVSVKFSHICHIKQHTGWRSSFRLPESPSVWRQIIYCHAWPFTNIWWYPRVAISKDQKKLRTPGLCWRIWTFFLFFAPATNNYSISSVKWGANNSFSLFSLVPHQKLDVCDFTGILRIGGHWGFLWDLSGGR